MELAKVPTLHFIFPVIWERIFPEIFKAVGAFAVWASARIDA